MNDRHDRLNRYIDRLLTERRSVPYVAEDDEERAVLQMAAQLRTLRPGADLPHQRFIRGMTRQLTRVMSPRRALSRRRLVFAGAGSIVAGLLAGIGLSQSGRGWVRLTTPAAPEVLPGWIAAGAYRDLADGSVLTFTTPQLSGHVLRVGDRLTALSAVCSHMGCRVDWTSREGEFICVCDGARFSRDGSFLSDSYSQYAGLRPLTKLEVQVHAGTMYVRPL